MAAPVGSSFLLLTTARRLCSASLKSAIWKKQTAPLPGGSSRLSTASKDREPVQDKASEDSLSLQAVSNAVGTKVKERMEKFIPLTRRTLLRMLIEQKGLLNSNDKRLMENVAAALDTKYSKRFYSILEQSKSLYDVMDPDKDTHQSKVPSRKQVLDNEYYLLQKVEKLLDKANFFEIPREQLLSLLHDHDTSGIIVSVNPSEYEQLRVWTRGWEVKNRSLYLRFKGFVWSLVGRTGNGSGLTPGLTPMAYTRVFLAVRCRGEKRLHLKVFKDIHANELEHLLPRGKIKMSVFDKGTLVSGVLLGVCLPFLRIVPILSDLKVQWMWGGVGLAAVIAGRSWISYKNKRNHYLATLR